MTVAHILSTLSSSEIVERVDVLYVSIEPTMQTIRARALLKGGFVLFVNESIGEDWRDYSYHLQKNDEFVIRWDNAPHWHYLVTFPHHVHEHGEGKPKPCREVFIEDVLINIEKIIEK